MSTATFSKTEARRRIRQALAEAGYTARGGFYRGKRQELQRRAVPVVLSQRPTGAQWHDPADDLADQYPDVESGLAREDERRHGQVVHVAFYDTGDFGSLIDIKYVWLGTPDHDPVAA